MKYAAAFIALLVLLFFTNPGPEKHRARIKEDLYTRMGSAGGANVNPTLLKATFDQAAETEVTADDYYLFSLTKITYLETTAKLQRTVGVGVLGKVFLWSGM